MHAVRLIAASLALAAALPATADVVVTVQGNAGPWDIALNPAFDYGQVANGQANVNGAPTVVGAQPDLAFLAGNTLTITAAPGASLLAGAGGTLWTDANGAAGWDCSAASCPGRFVPDAEKPMLLEVLMGVFAHDGVIVGTPFRIGLGPRDVVIPVGANALQLGVNDGWYNDNGGSVSVTIHATAAPVPVPAAIWLLPSALAFIGTARRR